MAMNVSAQATPMPETMPERRLFDSVRWMQSTATGPTVIDAATRTLYLAALNGAYDSK